MDEDVQHLLRKQQYHAAFEYLLTTFETKVFRMAVAFLKDSSRAEDVTQEIFLKLWQGLPDYDGRASPGTWLYSIARNTWLSALRSTSYRRVLPIDGANEPAISSAIQSDIELAQAVGRLPEVERTVITLFYLQDK